MAGLRVVVAGLGVSGAPAARALLRRGAEVTVVDAATAADGDGLAAELRAAGVTVRLGPGAVDGAAARDLTERADLVVVSPGWRPEAPVPAAAAAAGVPVWGDAELAWRLPGLDGRDAPRWLALTGTNGKTTAVRMLASVLSAAGRHALAAGNVGHALCAAVDGVDGAGHPLPGGVPDVMAVELSSFQLHWSTSLAPHAAAVLNVAPDHLDWHGGLGAYTAAKGRIWGRPGTSVAVAGPDDTARALLAAAPATARRVLTSLGPPSPDGLGVLDGRLVEVGPAAGGDGDAVDLGAAADLPAGGPPHVVADALVAAALARADGAPPGAVADGLRRTVLDPHRGALVVTDARRVRWVDDSKATNPHAAAAALRGAPASGVVWVAGGLAKGAAFDELVRLAAPRLAGVVLLGTDAPLIAASLARHAPATPVVVADAHDTAAVSRDPSALADAVVAAAARLAPPGGTVLLAPACASMDRFRDYGERGDAFAAAAQRHAAQGDR